MLTASNQWGFTYPNACIGVLALSNVHNPTDSMELGIRKEQLEEELRGRFAGMDRAALKTNPILTALQSWVKADSCFDTVLVVSLEPKPSWPLALINLEVMT